MMKNRLKTMGSVRRLAKQWVDLSRDRRRELLDSLDTDSRLAVIERMTEIRVSRKKVKGKTDD
jgi:hypothetical protein